MMFKPFSPSPWLLFFTVSVILSACSSPELAVSDAQKNVEPASQPNILIILADDAGWGDFGFQGAADLKTPNLDLLAEDGSIFTQAYVSASVCSPSRAGILTGRYQQRFGHECNLEPNQPTAFDSSQVTIAEAMQAEGYHTAAFGKWHLGERKHQHPLRNGFDHFYGFLAGGRSYFPSPTQDRVGDSHALLSGFQPTTFEGYLTDDLGNKAAAYVEERAKSTQPFFAYLAFNAPHTPMEATEEDLALFPDHERPVYAAMVYAMDRAIGRVVQSLKESGTYENTLVFFLSDNGGAHNNDSSVGPLKGWKGNQFEGGLRVPFVVSWPGHLPQGVKHSGMVSSLDIFATAVAAAGGTPAPVLDGTSLLPLLDQDDRTMAAHQTLFWRKDEMATVRHKDHKMIHLDNFGEVVYRMNNGMVDENNDLFRKEGNLMQDSLSHALKNWEAELMEPIWTEGGAWDGVTRHIYERLMQNKPALYKSPTQRRTLEQ